MSFDYDCKNEVARIQFDDGKANAMSVEWFEAFSAFLDRAEQEKARTLVLRGRQGFFSGGLDIRRLPMRTPDERVRLSGSFARTLLRLFCFPIPTIAQIEGHAVAGGAVLAMSCDLRFILDGPFRIQMNEVAIGIPMPQWIMLIAQSAVPGTMLVPFLLHATPLTPQQAVDRNIMHGLGSSPEAVSTLVEAAAQALAPLSREAYADSKRRMRASKAEEALHAHEIDRSL